MNKKILFSILLIAFLVLFLQTDIWAQCPMCKMSAESNMKNGGSMGKGLNRGILYMFALPYLLVSTIGFLWWKQNKKKSA